MLIAALLLNAAAALGAAPAEPSLPLVPARRIEFDTDEGTWMSLDRSPDGQTVVFDILGDLYTMSAQGGDAHAIVRGLAFDTQATFSPDGSLIAFVSDRSGADNVWVSRPDGSGARAVTSNTSDTMFVSPAWSADGRAIYASRFRADINSYELWSFGASGTGPSR